MLLYARVRVEAAEHDPRFINHLAGRAIRGKRTATAVTTKRGTAAAWAESVEITIPTMPLAQLLRFACDVYNARQLDRRGMARPPRRAIVHFLIGSP
jgi:hypothetical protein